MQKLTALAEDPKAKVKELVRPCTLKKLAARESERARERESERGESERDANEAIEVLARVVFRL